MFVNASGPGFAITVSKIVNTVVPDEKKKQNTDDGDARSLLPKMMLVAETRKIHVGSLQSEYKSILSKTRTPTFPPPP